MGRKGGFLLSTGSYPYLPKKPPVKMPMAKKDPQE